MTSTAHNYGQKCRLAPLRRSPHENGMPHAVSQFFYSSVMSIDDTPSAAIHTGSFDRRTAKQQFRPFGRGDNNMLEKAWSDLARKHSRREHASIRSAPSEGLPVDESAGKREQKVQAIIEKISLQHLNKHGGLCEHASEGGGLSQETTVQTVCCSLLHRDIAQMLHENFCSLLIKYRPELALETLSERILDAMGNGDSFRSNQSFACHLTSPSHNQGSRRDVEAKCPADIGTDTNKVANDLRRGRSPFSKLTDESIGNRAFSRTLKPSFLPPKGTAIPEHLSTSVEVAARYLTLSQQEEPVDNLTKENKDKGSEITYDASVSEACTVLEANSVTRDMVTVDVVVGISRLHKVSLPMLHMEPIYWSPVNDVAEVMRATWFYRDTMMPVAPLVANQLEAGYQELQPWTETWRDEVRCAIEIGPAGEEKISHYLWPQDSKHFHAEPYSEPEPRISSHPFCAARCFQGDAAARGALDTKDLELLPGPERINRPFSKYQVMYKDYREAFLLKPNLAPSAYYGRKPASKIQKGFTVGLPIIRGFDHSVWDRVNRKEQDSREAIYCDSDPLQLQDCGACDADTHSGQVTDLIFVAHGIGQKIAERVESYHFTHAINGFRRAVNLEMGTAAVQQVLRPGQNNVMILPLNWRLGLSFEQADTSGMEGMKDHRQETFGLKDIEPSTIPAVRSMISDVMFDIPFYMSHHKSKMIKALVSEANRVYRLWCQNNTGFPRMGRVHLIAHSLGSVMAVDVLSRQPTYVPIMDLSRAEPESRFFEFDTTNLFLLGSPAGFFLLLEQAALIPRRGRWKSGADTRDILDKNIVQDAGIFGCLAVDNIYNVLAKEDPIAYLLNGALDPAYAAGLRTAFVPSTSVSVLKSVADAVRQIVPGLSKSSYDALKQKDSERPSTARLPSQVELEVHDFTREEIAEKKAFLLNDNGQIDWFLRSGTGPLEIQYLNMLSAHTSYWVNQDFIRMLCVEVGRQPGRSYSLPSMRAVKATKRT
ncbi:hypothetical protein E4U10_007450 [Claviceps purpurea]|nr:hypothetical protein E4U10_007450 [Claviceps purpurea]